MAGPVVIRDKVVNQQRSARLQSLAKFPKDSDVVSRRFLMSNMCEDRVVVFARTEVRCMKVSIDCVEAVRHTEFSDESLCNAIHGRPVELRASRLLIR